LEALEKRAAEREPADIVTTLYTDLVNAFPLSRRKRRALLSAQPADEIDRYAALLQGVAFIERLCFDYLDMLGAPIGGPIVFTGGGGRAATGVSYARMFSADQLHYQRTPRRL